MPLIFLIEDDENIRELVSVSLRSASYSVETFETAEEAFAQMEQTVPDLFLIDLMLPGMSGLDAVRMLRKNHATESMPVLLLTAKDSEEDKVAGLDAGADDYVTKPFGVRELTARIRSLLRRSSNQPEKKRHVAVNGLSIDYENRQVLKDGRILSLTPKEYGILVALITADRVVSREELLHTVWGYDYIGESRTLDMHIRSLRQKLGDSAEHPKYIRTVRGVGFQFHQQVKE